MAYKDKEIEVMSKAEALWTKVKENTIKRIENTKQAIKDYQDSIIVDEEFLKLCNQKIKGENL